MGGDLRAGLAAGLIGLAAVANLQRNFTSGDYFLPVAASVIVPLLIVYMMRRAGMTAPYRIALVAAAGVWFTSITFVPASTTYSIPVRPWLLVKVFADAVTRSRTAASPVGLDAGFLLLAAAAAWLGAVLSEALAHRGKAVAAVSPWVVMFAFSSAMGATPRSGRLYGAMALALIAALYLIRSPEESAQAGDPLTKLAPAAASIGVVAMLASFLLPGFVPGYGWNALVKWPPRGPSSQTTISPLVQIRPRLTKTEETVLFTVKVVATPPQNVPYYWRLVALDRFDGRSWTSSADYVATRRQTRSLYPVAGRGFTLRQSYRVRGLGGLWLPAAYQPVSVDGVSSDWDRVGSALISGEIQPGRAYQVVSRVPAPTPEDLRGAPFPKAMERYTRLSGVSDPVLEIAHELTSGFFTPYDQVLRISNHLRTFKYDENVTGGHSADYLLRFLTRDRAGYCEQFAGAMAVLVRAAGLPARVAVGFLQGDYDPRSGSYVVTTEHAHAWPEVYFEGVGWVPFEPTPRSLVSLPAYATGREADPRSDAQERALGERLAVSPQVRALERAEPPVGSRGAPVPSRGGIPGFWRGLGVAILIAVQALVLVAVGKEFRTRLRYRAARTEGERIQAAYRAFEDRASDAVRARKSFETRAEFAGVVEQEIPIQAASVGVLVHTFEESAYAPKGFVDRSGKGDVARVAASDLRQQIWRSSNWSKKLKLLFSPRTLFSRGPVLPMREKVRNADSERSLEEKRSGS